MQHPSRLRQLTASVSITALLLGTWAPLAAAQSAPTPSGETRAAPSAPSQAPSPTPAPPAAGSPEQAQPGAEDAADAGASEGAHSAEEQREAARVAFEAGRAAFDDEDYARAYEQFAAAHERVPSPHAEYWMAASLDLQGGREAEAARAYQKFLAHPGAMHVGEDKVAEARQRLDELKAKLPARITIVTEPSGAQIAVNGVLQSGTSPLMLELPAGPHRIEATLPGRQRAEAELQLQGGDELEQRLLLPEEPTAAPAPPASEPPPPALEPSERSMLPAYITLGLAGAGLATGTVFGIQALSARSAYNDDPTASRADRVERNALIADMAFGIAITLGITGIVLLTSSDDAPQTAKAKKKQPTLAVAPVVAPQLGGAAARLTF
ncbi:MAG: PEGA domain-containing protein [Myxococcales bacterium]|nr:PEGA domain-containing protein [Myxococcales bacterium]